MPLVSESGVSEVLAYLTFLPEVIFTINSSPKLPSSFRKNSHVQRIFSNVFESCAEEKRARIIMRGKFN